MRRGMIAPILFVLLALFLSQGSVYSQTTQPVEVVQVHAEPLLNPYAFLDGFICAFAIWVFFGLCGSYLLVQIKKLLGMQ